MTAKSITGIGNGSVDKDNAIKKLIAYQIDNINQKPWLNKNLAALGTSITSQNYYPPILAELSGVNITNLGVSGASVSSSSNYLGGGFWIL